jgi:CRISPR-associated protein Cas2
MLLELSSMTVLICNDVPPAIRGHLKRWFIEPRPNVFVGTLNVRTHRKVMEFILRNAPPNIGVLSISSAQTCQGYEIERIGPEGSTGRKGVDLSGLQLIAEDWIDPENVPF